MTTSPVSHSLAGPFCWCIWAQPVFSCSVSWLCGSAAVCLPHNARSPSWPISTPLPCSQFCKPLLGALRASAQDLQVRSGARLIWPFHPQHDMERVPLLWADSLYMPQCTLPSNRCRMSGRLLQSNLASRRLQVHTPTSPIRGRCTM